MWSRNIPDFLKSYLFKESLEPNEDILTLKVQDNLTKDTEQKPKFVPNYRLINTKPFLKNIYWINEAFGNFQK